MPGHDGCKSLAVYWLLLGGAGTVEEVIDGGLLGEVVVVPLAVVAVVEDLLAEFLGELEHPAGSTTAKAVMARKAGRFSGWALPNEGKVWPDLGPALGQYLLLANPAFIEPISNILRHSAVVNPTYSVKMILTLIALMIGSAMAPLTTRASSAVQSRTATTPISGVTASLNTNVAHSGLARSDADSIGFLSGAPNVARSVSVWSWSGQKVANVKLGHDVQCCAGTPQLSPNGRLILVPSESGISGTVTTLAGSVVTRLRYADGIWASDSEHFCAFSSFESEGYPTTQYASVDIESIDGGARPVGRVQISGPHFEASIAECDPDKNRAIIFSNFAGVTSSVSYLNLSTGATRAPKWSSLGAVALSGNGRYIAFDTGAIRNAETGALVADVDQQVLAISWLGHVVIKRVGCRTEALDWVTNRILWMSAGPANPPCQIESVVAASQPRRDTVALNVGNGLGDDNGAALWLVQLQRKSMRIATNVQLGLV
jgi:hypothetical protein